MFPEYKRVIYNKNPLAQVICQFKFPEILRIETELPAEFQEKIRERFPNYQQSAMFETQLEFQVDSRGTIVPGASSGPVGLSRLHQFISLSKNHVAILTKDSVGLLTTSYHKWEDFKADFKFIVETFEALYKPTHYNRVGLRYQDVIQRSILGLSDTSWSELFQPYIAGELSSQDRLPDRIEQIAKEVFFRLDEASFLRLRHGFVKKHTDLTTEICYLLDGDFFNQSEVNQNDAINTLDKFNQEAGRLFRWAISDTLHNAMLPTPVSG